MIAHGASWSCVRSIDDVQRAGSISGRSSATATNVPAYRRRLVADMIGFSNHYLNQNVISDADQIGLHVAGERYREVEAGRVVAVAVRIGEDASRRPVGLHCYRPVGAGVVKEVNGRANICRRAWSRRYRSTVT